MTNTHPTHPSRHIRIERVRRAVAVLALFVPLVVVARPAAGADDPMRIRVVAPSDDTVVPTRFPVRIKTNVAIGEPDTGRHHIHLYWDGERDEGEYDIVYKKRFTKKGLEPGTHTLDAVIANADHSTTDAHDVLQVSVSDEAPAPQSGPTPSDGTNDRGPSGAGY
jgi:hypothetical protein